MVRVVTAPITGTDLIGARIKGLRESVRLSRVHRGRHVRIGGAAWSYAKDKLLRGESLPEFEKPPVIVPDEVIKCVRLSTLRALIKQRWEARGVEARSAACARPEPAARRLRRADHALCHANAEQRPHQA